MPRLINLEKIPSRHRRPAKSELPPWQPGKAGVRVLDILRRYRYLTTDMAGVIYAAEQGRGVYEVRRQLTKLWRYGYAERHFRPTEWGSNQFVYTLALPGGHLVIDDEHWSENRWQIENLARPKSQLHYEHALATSLLQLLWKLGSPEQEHLFTTPRIWRDKEGNGDRVINEFRASVDGKPERVQPDLTVLIGHKARGFYRPYFFEIERSHKNRERLRRKMLAYGFLLSRRGERAVQEVFQREVGVVPQRGMTVYVGADQGHADRLRAFAAELLPRDTEIWFTSLDQLTVRQSKLHKDGRPYLNRRGEPIREEVPIEPGRFFEDDLLVALDGKRGAMVI